ncbi:MAG TPA: hypothetical protein VGJ33_01175 [Candidatus Angelobacter sp.]
MSTQFNAPDPRDPVVQFKFRIVEILGLLFFLILVTDTAVTELSPIIKHIWHTLLAP